MADMGLRRKVLADRFNTHTTHWFSAALTKASAEVGMSVLALVHIEVTDVGFASEPTDDGERDELESTLGVKIVRYLGEGDYIVTFDDNKREGELFKNGYLTYEAEGLRLTAL